MSQIDYENAKMLLQSLFLSVETQSNEVLENFLSAHAEDLNKVFDSRTQSYREVLLGCALVRLLNPNINVRLPYKNHGEGSFNGRSLDEEVINPFFQNMLIPCSKGPYLATFRRNVKLTKETKKGLRDKTGYDAMLKLLKLIENTIDEEELKIIIMALLKRFAILRDSSKIPLSQLSRISVEQYRSLLPMFVQRPSGGLIPVLICVAFFQALNDYYVLSWEISWQGINVSDQATDTEGDVTIKLDGDVILVIEITERPVDQRRVISTFNTKIIRNNIAEYLFVYSNSAPDEKAKQAAQLLFSQGYDVNFTNIIELVISNLVVQRPKAREIFMEKILTLLSSMEVPSSIKIAWNECIKDIISF